MKCDMCGKEKLLFEANTGVCADCYNRYFNFQLKNNQLEEKVQNLEESLNEVKDTADNFSKELKVCERALDLACETLNRVGVRPPYANFGYYLHQAQKELEEEK